MTKTNPEYAALAYENAILQDTIAMLTRRYLPDEGGENAATLVCHEVFHSEAEVPEGAFVRVVGDMEQRCAQLQQEMKKFELRKIPDGSTKQSSTTKNSIPSKKGRAKRATRAK